MFWEVKIKKVMVKFNSKIDIFLKHIHLIYKYQNIDFWKGCTGSRRIGIENTINYIRFHFPNILHLSLTTIAICFLANIIRRILVN